MNQKHANNRQRRKQKTVKKIKVTAERPRLHVYRSNRYIYAQVIDLKEGKIIAAASEKGSKAKGETKTQKAIKVGEAIAKKATQKGVKEVAFDRGSYKYQGRVKALAEGARKAGLVF